jgi:hypothetical protein
VVNAEFFRYAQDDKDLHTWQKSAISAQQLHTCCLALLYGHSSHYPKLKTARHCEERILAKPIVATWQSVSVG